MNELHDANNNNNNSNNNTNNNDINNNSNFAEKHLRQCMAVSVIS